MNHQIDAGEWPSFDQKRLSGFALFDFRSSKKKRQKQEAAVRRIPDTQHG
jgi:hypothetical protein